MASFGAGPLAHLEGELERDDPRFATEQGPVVTVGVVLAAAGGTVYQGKRRDRDRDDGSPR